MSALLMEIKSFGTQMWVSVFGVAIRSKWDARYRKRIIVNQSTQYLS